MTPVLLRYPAGKDHWHYAPNAERPFGYHDDSFAWATLDTGREADSWYFLPSLKAAGPQARSKWESHPIGGEIRPELWGQIFDTPPQHPQAQDFDRCVRETHVTWLLDTGMFRQRQSEARIRTATEQVSRMGYEFQIVSAQVSGQSRTMLSVSVRNTGVAPFYYDWKLELGALDREGRLLKAWPTAWRLTQLLPGDSDRIWRHELESLPDQTERIAVRVVNPLPNGLPLRFANKRPQPNGWMELAAVRR